MQGQFNRPCNCHEKQRDHNQSTEQAVPVRQEKGNREKKAEGIVQKEMVD